MSLQTNLILGEVRAELGRAQVAEGYTAQHDDQLVKGELLLAALERLLKHEGWPVEPSKIVPQDNRDKLVEAAGLIVSEIARLDRKAGTIVT